MEPGTRAMSPYGNFDEVLDVISGALLPGPYLLGEVFSAADILWATALGWTTAFKIVPSRPEYARYCALVEARPAMQRAREKDAALAAAQVD